MPVAIVTTLAGRQIIGVIDTRQGNNIKLADPLLYFEAEEGQGRFKVGMVPVANSAFISQCEVVMAELFELDGSNPDHKRLIEGYTQGVQRLSAARAGLVLAGSMPSTKPSSPLVK